MSILGLICVLLALVATLLFVLFMFQRRDLRAVTQLSLSVQRALSGERLPQRIEIDQEQLDLQALGVAINQLLMRAARTAGREKSGPRLFTDETEPGTAKTSLPYSAANRAVISEPLSSAASVTTTPKASPLIMRLRRGKLWLKGCEPSGSSDNTAPCRSISRRRARCSAGYVRSRPQPITAMVRPAAA